MLPAKQDSVKAPEEGPVLLAFGVGFSYQLGLEEPDSTTDKNGSVGISGYENYRRVTGSSAGPRGERASPTAGGMSQVLNDHVRVCEDPSWPYLCSYSIFKIFSICTGLRRAVVPLFFSFQIYIFLGLEGNRNLTNHILWLFQVAWKFSSTSTFPVRTCSREIVRR